MAQFVEIEIDQGTDFTLDLSLKNDDGTYLNFDGYSFDAQIRKSHNSIFEVANFVINSSNRRLFLSLDAEVTSLIKSGRYVFDIKQTNLITGKVSRLAEGIVTINPQVSK